MISCPSRSHLCAPSARATASGNGAARRTSWVTPPGSVRRARCDSDPDRGFAAAHAAVRPFGGTMPGTCSCQVVMAQVSRLCHQESHMPDLSAMLERGPVVCAEGYLFECERRGYLQAGAFVPEVVLDHPEVVTELHREFVHAGSDVVEAFTYYAHREKLRVLGKEHLLEELNRRALDLAREVADETGALFAGDLSNTNVFVAEDASRKTVRAIFEEQLGWAVEAGVDFVIGETFSWGEEALIALNAMRETGLPAVVTLAIHQDPATREGWPPDEACKRLEDAGADVVGLNCIRGPRTMLPLLRAVRATVGCHVAALPVPYRTHAAQPSMQSLRDPE